MKLIEIFLGIIAVVEICKFVLRLIDFSLDIYCRRKDTKNLDQSLAFQEQIVNLQKQNVQLNEEGKKALNRYSYLFTTLESRIKALEEKQPKE
jgi:hypothetical protein